MLRSVAATVAFLLLATGAADAAPRNGRIFYSDGYRNLVSIRTDGSHLKRVSDEGWRLDLAPAPDGRSLIAPAFQAHDAFEILSATTGAVTARVELPGRTNLRFPEWSPGGREVAFEECADPAPCEQPSIYRVRPGHEPEFLAKGLSPSWSPDGRSLVFMKARPNPRGYPPECHDVYVARRDGRGARRIYPRGRKCAFRLSVASRPFFLRGGRRIAFAQGQSLWSVRLDGTHVRRILDTQPGFFLGPAKPSPDRRRIVYVESPENRAADLEIYVKRADRNGRGRLVKRVSGVAGLAWMPVPSR